MDEAGLDAEVEEGTELTRIERVEETHLADQSIAIAGEVDTEVCEGEQHGTGEVAEIVHERDGTQPA